MGEGIVTIPRQGVHAIFVRRHNIQLKSGLQARSSSVGKREEEHAVGRGGKHNSCGGLLGEGGEAWLSGCHSGQETCTSADMGKYPKVASLGSGVSSLICRIRTPSYALF